MKPNILSKIILNFFAVIILVALIALPFYIARNVSKVAGIKSETPFLVVSQVEKFPGMFLGQEGNRYEISFNRQFSSQAYLSVLIINNPTGETKTYSLKTASGQTKIFFGEDYQNLIVQIDVPAGASVPISILSEGDPFSIQTAEFIIEAK